MIYNLFQHGSSLILFGFQGNYAYLWDSKQSMQLFTVDTKGGNRPIRVAVRQTPAEESFGRLFAMAYAFADKLVVQDNWNQLHFNAAANGGGEQSFALEDSLHGREILAVLAIRLMSGKHLVVTGSEDTYIKVSEVAMNQNQSQFKIV